MSQSFKPENYNCLSPYLIVDDVARLTRQLMQIFGATELRRYEDKGRVVHLELKIADSVLMMSSGSDNYPSSKAILHCYVPDAGATFKAAVEAGCTSVQEPVKHPGDPDVRGTFIDCAGNLWSVSTQVEAG